MLLGGNNWNYWQIEKEKESYEKACWWAVSGVQQPNSLLKFMGNVNLRKYGQFMKMWAKDGLFTSFGFIQ